MNSALKYILLSAFMTLLFVVTKNGYASSNFSAFSEAMRTAQLRLPNVTIRDALHGIDITENLFRAMDSKSITNDYSNPATVFTGSGFLYGGSANCNVDIISNGNRLPDYLTPADHATLAQPLLSYHSDTTAAIPEPEAILLLSIALLGASTRRRYKNT